MTDQLCVEGATWLAELVKYLRGIDGYTVKARNDD